MKDAIMNELPENLVSDRNGQINVIKKASRMMYGSCNACTARVGTTVTVIEARGMSVRFCDSCLEILKKAL